MSCSDKDAPDRNEETKAFDPPLIHEQKIERSATADEEEEGREKEQSPELEENEKAREKTEVATKEAMLRVPSGQL